MGMPERSLWNVKIVELSKEDGPFPTLKYRYETVEYYDVSICRQAQSWKIELALKPLHTALVKHDESRLFREYVEEPQVFAAEMDGDRVGWLELGYHPWTNRMRVWQFVVNNGFRRKGIGALLKRKAVAVSKAKGARMLILETQTCNVPAINFYLKCGFRRARRLRCHALFE
jgi:ribosomal protein S18 acetylase RimI-like enzyme